MRSASPPTRSSATPSPSSTAAPISPRAKDANVKLLIAAEAEGPDDDPARDHAVEDRAGLDHPRHPRRRAEDQVRPDHRPDGLGRRRATSSRPAASSSPARTATPIPTLSPTSKRRVPGIYVIGALAGYPLIKHCMNQGYDVVEFINGNTELKPADEPILEEKFAGLPGRAAVDRMARLPAPPASTILERAVAAADARVHARFRGRASIAPGDVVFERNDPGSSLFAIADGSVAGRDRPERSVDHRADRAGLDLRRGRPDLGPQARRHGPRRRGRDRRRDPAQRGAEADGDRCRRAKRAITRISTERQLLQMFGSG